VRGVLLPLDLASRERGEALPQIGAIRGGDTDEAFVLADSPPGTA